MPDTVPKAQKRSVVPATKQPVRRLDVKELLDGAREVVLLHAREEYRLRLTSNGKLILTK